MNDNDDMDDFLRREKEMLGDEAAFFTVNDPVVIHREEPVVVVERVATPIRTPIRATVEEAKQAISQELLYSTRNTVIGS